VHLIICLTLCKILIFILTLLQKLEICPILLTFLPFSLKIVIDVNLKDSESMKIRPNLFVSLLYSGMQCGSCGLRFPAEQTVRYSAHLDWHFRQNRREKGASKRPQSRKWYYKVTDWIQFEETESVENDKRLNWFEAQASDSKDQGADRNGDDLMS